ncbi:MULTISPECIES: metal-sulfur cluster assembly factor [Bifidobacterium]|uniref:Metal-sulfur cluster assembly factor n=1 Tax=Bifidobacterium apousia TaxID=2750996 RepID=A0A556R2J4_9BIFI|nr:MULTISPECIES: metal-sulfur cluster assembly factor [Bifidobacterium]MBI0070860.1 metal-sulfur cluster assembly factor [Bifidobacterium sp. W8112]MBI0125167.1 metal-sulfur cluster assembly factor [Bifidobacterium apousia]MBI0136299.1 metal-sulfur cluster assembly factor [Bifidobacterium sp. W8120]TSJ83111.1 metal-sulfur cluster assembly factor [Bifidobacterium apousia]
MSGNTNLVPEPQDSILASVGRAISDPGTAQALASNPLGAETVLKSAEGGSMRQVDGQADKKSDADQSSSDESSASEPAANSEKAADQNAADTEAAAEEAIPLKAVDDIGRATAEDVREALHQVIDPELGIDVVDLGLVYGIEIDELGRAIITMTLTTPACPLTDLIEDQCASVLAGLVEEFRIDWTWSPRWTLDMITPEGREQLAAIGFNFENMPTYQ